MQPCEAKSGCVVGLLLCNVYTVLNISRICTVSVSGEHTVALLEPREK